MTQELTASAVAEQALKGITIPPRPTLLVDINKELGRDEPDFRRISAQIARDVGISAAMLKTINSPLFGLRTKVGNPLQAVQMLGAKNVRDVVTALILRASVGGNNLSLERFWESSERVAEISAFLCKLLPRSPREEAYMFGLFHDCGIPLLMQRFPDYRETLKAAAASDRPMPEVEDKHHGTNHAVLGYMVAKSWGLAPELCEAILRHHDLTVFDTASPVGPMVPSLVAIIYLAEHLNNTMLRLRSDEEQERIIEIPLNYLGLSRQEYNDLREDIVNFFH